LPGAAVQDRPATAAPPACPAAQLGLPWLGSARAVV